MPDLPSDKSSKGRKARARKRKAEGLAQDPTSIFLSALRSTHPEALAALARTCEQQSAATKPEPVDPEAPKVEAAPEPVELEAIEPEPIELETQEPDEEPEPIDLDATELYGDSEPVQLEATEPDEEPEPIDLDAPELHEDSEPVELDATDPDEEPEPIELDATDPDEQLLFEPSVDALEFAPSAEVVAVTPHENVCESEEVIAAKDAEADISESSADNEEAAPPQPSKKGPVAKAPLRIEAAPPPPKPELKQISGDAITNIPGAFDKGIKEEFKGTYEKATQRGGVFDAQHRDAFSSESEKKVKSSYLGLKAISLDEALTIQPEVNPAIMRSQSQNVIAPEPPATFADKAKAVWAIVDKMHSTPVIVSAAIICLSFLGFFVGNLVRGEGLMQDGEKLFAAGKYHEAIKVLTESAELNPMRARTLFFRGRAFNKIGETGKAIEDFSRAISINPRSHETFDHRASIYIKNGNYEQALADYKTIFALLPDDKTEYRLNSAAIAARQCGKYEEAINYYGKALQLSPADTNAIIGQAMCQVSLNHAAEAIALCDQLLAKKPDELEAHLVRGWCYMLLKRNDAASRDFNFVLAFDRTNAKAYLNRGMLHYNEGNLAAAVQDYNRAVAADPDSVEARNARGWAIINTNPEMALEDLRATTNRPQFSNSIELWKARAELEVRLGENKNALGSYNKVIKLASAFDRTQLTDLYADRAGVLNSLRKYDEAVASADEALKLNARNVRALSMRGVANDSRGNGISAVADFAAAIAIDPKAVDALWFRSLHFNKTHEYHSAQKDLQDYLKLRPADKSARTLLAAVTSKTTHSATANDMGEAKQNNRFRNVPFEQLVASGLKEMNAGRTEVAADMLRAAVKQNPSDVTTRRYLCHVLVREDPKAAVAQFDILRGVVALQPEDERSYCASLSLAATGTLGEAAAICKALKTVADEPGNLRACYKLSTLYAAAGMLSKAAQYCQSGMASAKNPAETKKFQDLYQKLNKQNIEGEHKEDIQG